MTDDYDIEDFDPEQDIAPPGQDVDADGNADCDGAADDDDTS